jgi:hypothetical protein
MLGSITPLGERGRRSKWGITMTAFLTASAAGGAGVGAVLGLLGGALPRLGGPEAPRLWVLAGLIALGVAMDIRAAGMGLPTVHRQVNEDWLHRYRGWVYGAGFGFQLGAGVVTVVNVSAVYTAMAAALLAASPARGAAIGAVFGLLRAAAAFSVSRVRRPAQLAAVDARLRAWDAPSRRVALGLEVALAGLCLMAAIL